MKDNKFMYGIKYISYISYIGFSFATPIFIFIYIGRYFQNIFKFHPNFLILFLLLGIVSSFYNTYKSIKKIISKN
ncbi:MAG: AtpZ/AtpI family protein [Oscillospiraceae bacterium]|nr:AtpZ/AtpI family protein [Oscillospiraceae bacterium]